MMKSLGWLVLVAVVMTAAACQDESPAADAGTHDSATADTSTPDSAAPDSATPDAAMTDATVGTDAAMTDAAMTDATVSADAAMTDATVGADAAMVDADGLDADAPDAEVDAAMADAGPTLTVEEFCTSFRDLLCAWNPVCREPGAVGCNFNYAIDLTRACARFASREAAGALSFDPVAGAACLQHSFVTCGIPRPFETPECLGAFVPHVPVGGDCYQATNRPFDNECAAGAVCDTSAGSCPGVCIALRTAGQTCGAGSPCSPDTVCVAGTCETRTTVGQACNTVACAAPLSCMNNVCRLSVGLGETCSMTSPCTGTLLCQGGVCVDHVATGAVCNTRDYLCPDGDLCIPDGAQTRCTTTLMSGAPCDINGDTRQCGTDGMCITFTDPPGDRCVTPPGIGDSCALMTCAAGLFCFENECRQRSAVGGPCNTHTDCADGIAELFCDAANQCQARHPNGDTCTSGDMCLSGNCGPDTNLVDRCFTPAPTCVRPD